MSGFGGNDKMVFKKKLLVELELDTGTVLNGYLFLGQTQRLSDLMNDDRTFLPFEDMDGGITIFTKGMARRVKPVEKAQTAAADITDPYAVLGVPRDAPDAQVREAYHQKVQETHPDKLSNLGLSPDLVKFAHERMARINEAYNKIRMARRKAAAAQAAHNAAAGNGHAPS
ncbi:MAG TPA: J domain-containing protein [Candidatus Acidoferrum sp.]|nr:J domain-containing protein [Candidatus Acidoferrum sp.]